MRDVAGLRRSEARADSPMAITGTKKFNLSVRSLSRAACIEIPPGLLSSYFNPEIHSRAALLPRVFICSYLSLVGARANRERNCNNYGARAEVRGKN